MSDLEKTITRFITIQINSIKVRDINYATEYLKKNFENISKYIINNREIKDLYHKYRLGVDILAVLNTDKYYYNLPIASYPTLYEVVESKKENTLKRKKKKNKDADNIENIFSKGFVAPPEYAIIKEQIPIVRKRLVKLCTKYVAFMELKKWVETKGITKIEVESKKNMDTSFSDDYFNGKTNKFNKMPLELVYKYFMQLAKETPVQFLTEGEVIKFIDRAFCSTTKKEKLTFKNVKRKQGVIWKLFHNFYEDCTTNTIYESTKLSKKKYVELVTLNFDNWNFKSVFDNFANGSSKHWLRIKDFK
jgi:hypothetical protein